MPGDVGRASVALESRSSSQTRASCGTYRVAEIMTHTHQVAGWIDQRELPHAPRLVHW